jgi:hypothetical protein
VDAETRLELAFECAPGDVRRYVLVYGFNTSSTDVEELERHSMTVSPGMQKRETYLESGTLAEFPHVFFLVVPDETSRAIHRSLSAYRLDTRK